MPAADVWAAATTAADALKKIIVAKKTFTGASARPTAGAMSRSPSSSGRRRRPPATRRPSSARSTRSRSRSIPDHTDRSQSHQPECAPLLVQEALKAQSTHIYIISGATYTSDAFAQSLQAAITRRRRGSRDAAGRPARRARDGDADRHRPSRRGRRTAISWTRRFASSAQWTRASAPTGTTARSCASTAASCDRDAHPDVREILERCEALRAETRRLLRRPRRAPSMIDPRGLSRAGRSTASLRSSTARACATSRSAPAET